MKVTLLLVISSLSASASPLVLNLNGNSWLASSAELGMHLKATVPGSMYTDLLANKVIEDPYNRYNDIRYAKYSMYDWQYKRSFTVSSFLKAKESIDLVCHGIDTISVIYINGVIVGKTSNQFIKYRFPIKHYLNTGSNELVINFTSAVTYAASQSKAYPYIVPPVCPPDVQHGQCHPNFIRKEQASFSWDWGPSFPTQGIWKDILIEGYDSVMLEDFSVEVSKADGLFWRLNVTGHIQGLSTLNAPQLYICDINIANVSASKTFEFSLQKNSSNTLRMELLVDETDLELWWPNGYGKQALYNLSVSCYSSSSNRVTKSKHIGFRTVELIQQPIKGAKGLSFYFKINGQPIFMKGSNWIPADSFQSRLSKDKLQNLLYSAKLAHMNMLRVWGGGVYEQADFYELADEMGILIWQDVMFACAMYPTDQNFLENIRSEITHQVHRLKHHPSLALWAGNNENEAALRDNWYDTENNFTLYQKDYIELYIKTVKETINKEHMSGIFVSSSPSNAAQSEKEGWIAQNPYDTKYGDVHYYNYAAGRYYNDDYPRSRFMSEYGYQSWPSFSSLKPHTISQDWNEFSEFALYRNHHGQGQEQMNSQIRYYFNPPTSSDPASNFSNYIYLTQINQAMYIRMVSEFCRRSQNYLYGDEGMTMGALYWQLNDIWPGPSWSSLEFSGSWKILHYYAKRFFAPNMISMAVESGNLTVYIIQDNNRNLQSTTLTLYCYSWASFVPQSNLKIPVQLADVVSNWVFNENLNKVLEKLNCTDQPRHFLFASWEKSLYSEFILSPYKDITTLQKPNIEVGLIGEYPRRALVLRTDRIAPFVWVSSDIPHLIFQDNGFLLKDQQITINFTTPDNKPLSVSNFTVKSLMDIYL
ncbi:manba [Bugula neritina]|uniref:beta-mannosidase n=1 Tax=Bugula neritina TaxID=10212 RepID=A0A7J7J234_BUGNE|nr:manba [Bugula neritina]